MAALARAFEGMGVDDDTAVETTRTLCRAETMYCFKVPPRGPQGYSAKLLKEHRCRYAVHPQPELVFGICCDARIGRF